MKVVLELKNAPRVGDILICDKDGVKSVSKNIFLSEVNKKLLEIDELKAEIAGLKEEIKYLKGE